MSGNVKTSIFYRNIIIVSMLSSTCRRHSIYPFFVDGGIANFHDFRPDFVLILNRRHIGRAIIVRVVFVAPADVHIREASARNDIIKITLTQSRVH